MRIEAASLDLGQGHLNRLPFKGVLCRIDVASDAAPHGSGGRRVVVTRAAAQTAVSSLVGQGINAAPGLRAHAPTAKCGVITAARVAGDRIEIEGHLWALDLPEITASIRSRTVDLGLSFEASDVQAAAGDPMVVTRCTFTGASVLLRTDAAWRSTSLAAAAQRDIVPVHSRLLQALTARGIDRCEDGDKLSSRQVAQLLAERDPEDRIALRMLIAAAALTPEERPS